MKMRFRLVSLSAPIIALTISFGLSSLILLIIGKDPYETFKIMFEYGIRGKSIVSIINRSIPLYISAIAVAVGFKMGFRLVSLSAPIIALTISFGLSSLILLIIGKDPYETFKIMFEYGIRGKSIVSIINRSIPLYISAIAVAVGFKMGLFNIGVEGQYLMG